MPTMCSSNPTDWHKSCTITARASRSMPSSRYVTFMKTTQSWPMNATTNHSMIIWGRRCVCESNPTTVTKWSNGCEKFPGSPTTSISATAVEEPAKTPPCRPSTVVSRSTSDYQYHLPDSRRTEQCRYHRHQRSGLPGAAGRCDRLRSPNRSRYPHDFKTQTRRNHRPNRLRNRPGQGRKLSTALKPTIGLCHTGSLGTLGGMRFASRGGAMIAHRTGREMHPSSNIFDRRPGPGSLQATALALRQRLGASTQCLSRQRRNHRPTPGMYRTDGLGPLLGGSIFDHKTP